MTNAGNGPDDRHRTTLYLDAGLAIALKQLAARCRRPVNTLIVEAIQGFVATYRDETVGTSETALTGEAGVALRRDLDRLSERIVRLEAVVHGRTPSQGQEDVRPLLRAADVRREARARIEAHGRPMPHHALLAALEREFILPGKNASANLRTILVHPKTRGFVLVKGAGYAVDDDT
jgi:hypothetical protein